VVHKRRAIIDLPDVIGLGLPRHHHPELLDVNHGNLADADDVAYFARLLTHSRSLTEKRGDLGP
jgi:hypothetical protein